MSSNYITKRELERAIKAAGSLDAREEETVRMLFLGAFDTDQRSDRHLSVEEIDQGLAHLRKTIGRHHLSASEIDELEQKIRRFL